jgi:3-deoxy-D-manno-octulosonate 8-phosphate phosphatase (KDO 8-P phosphatase)
MPPSASEAARHIRLLLLDVDGVLSDGRIYYSAGGDELKAFHIHDGLGIKLLQRQGIEVGIITGRTSPLLERRARELGIDRLIQGREDKLRALEELRAGHPVPMEQIAYMGDDLPDLAVIRRVGLGMTVADCNPEVARHARWQATRKGGEGAVREAAEFILDAQGKLAPVLESYR